MTKDTITLYRLLAQALTYPNQDFIADLKTAVGKINLELFVTAHNFSDDVVFLLTK